MFHKQKSINLATETKTLILLNEPENTLVKEVEKHLGVSLKTYTKEALTTLTPLGKMKSESVIVLDPEKALTKKGKETVFKAIAGLKEDAVILLDTFEESFIQNLFEGLTKAIYRFNKYKSEDPKDTATLSYVTTKDVEALIHKGIVIGESINHARELVNTPYNYLNAEKLAAYAKSLESIENVKVDIYEKDACEKMNMGAYLGVNKGSTDAPKLIHITYTGNKNSDDLTTLVGKGVMYDTGGYSLKTPQSMPSMKMDMGGSASVLGAIEAIATLKADANVSVVIAATDNRIGDNAIVPDDILTSAKGLTIEIVSTDAEGRLTLADALWFAQEKGATRIIDLATLTGAVVAALGKAYTGAFTNNVDFLEELKVIAEKNDEPLWHMPITDTYRDELKSYAADISNKGGRLAGASIAAAFLEKFVEKDVPWIHLDIAGTAYESKTGATGVLVKSLTELFVK